MDPLNPSPRNMVTYDIGRFNIDPFDMRKYYMYPYFRHIRPKFNHIGPDPTCTYPNDIRINPVLI